MLDGRREDWNNVQNYILFKDYRLILDLADLTRLSVDALLWHTRQSSIPEKIPVWCDSMQPQSRNDEE